MALVLEQHVDALDLRKPLALMRSDDQVSSLEAFP
jgi:hypothetical protein